MCLHSSPADIKRSGGGGSGMEIFKNALELQHSKGRCPPPSSSLGKLRTLSSEAAFVLVFPLWVFLGGLWYILFECPQLCQIFEGVICKCEVNRDGNITVDSYCII